MGARKTPKMKKPRGMKADSIKLRKHVVENFSKADRKFKKSKVDPVLIRVDSLLESKLNKKNLSKNEIHKILVEIVKIDVEFKRAKLVLEKIIEAKIEKNIGGPTVVRYTKTNAVNMFNHLINNFNNLILESKKVQKPVNPTAPLSKYQKKQLGKNQNG